MISCIFDLLQSKYFLAYWVICIIFVEAGLRRLTKLKPKNKEEVEIDEKFKSFKMIGTVATENILYRIVLYLFAPLSVFRFSLAAFTIFVNAVFIYTTVQILGRGNPIFKYLAFITTTITGRILCWCASIVWITVERPKVCYKKFLGPDWKPSYENPGSIVANHTSWADIAVTMSRRPPANVAKASVERLPGIGIIAKSVGSIFVERVNKE